MFSRVVKGEYGYLNKRRVRQIIYTILFFAISIGIIITGYVTTGTKRNLLTVVGILGCLPACKSAVNMIMLIKAKGCSQNLYSRTESTSNNLISMYDMYFTSYSKNFQVSAMIVNKGMIIACSEDNNFDEEAFRDHINTMLKQAGLRDFTVTSSKNIDKFITMVENSNNNSASLDELQIDDEIRVSLYQIIL